MPSKPDLEKQVETLAQKLLLMSEEIEWMRMIVGTVGIDGPWVSPAVAGSVFGRSRERVMADINLAESLRCNKKQQVDFVYGIHYRNDQTVDSGQPTWKVNLIKYSEYTRIPPDQIKIAC